MPTPPSKPLLTTRAARHALLTPTPAHRRQIPPDSDAGNGFIQRGISGRDARFAPGRSLRTPPAAPGVRRAPAGPPRSAGRGTSAGVACTTAAPPQRSRGARGDRFPLPPIPAEGAQRGGRGRPSAGRDEQRQHGNGDAPARCGSPARGPAPPRSSGARAAPGRATRPAQPQLPQGHPPAPRPWPGCGSRRGEQAGGAGTRTRDRSRPHSAHAQHSTAALPAPPLKGPLRGGK